LFCIAPKDGPERHLIIAEPVFVRAVQVQRPHIADRVVAAEITKGDDGGLGAGKTMLARPLPGIRPSTGDIP
jgi:hypothetical protein